MTLVATLLGIGRRHLNWSVLTTMIVLGRDLNTCTSVDAEITHVQVFSKCAFSKPQDRCKDNNTSQVFLDKYMSCLNHICLCVSEFEYTCS